MILKSVIKSLFFVLILSLVSCTHNSFDVQLDEQVKMESIRFDKELMQVDTAELQKSIDLFYQKYPIFFPTYTYGVLGIGGREQKEFPIQLKAFVSNSITKEVFEKIQKEYDDVLDIQSEIEKSFSYYKYYFPEEVTPRLFFFQSGFNQRIIVDSLVLGVALDMCLGGNNDYYKQLALPMYLAKGMNKENIALDAMRALTWSNFTFEGEDNLATNMIYEGKIQYFMDALFPDKTDAEKLSYSEDDLRWVNKHAEEIWDVIIQEEMLYQTDRMKIKNMIKNAPFTQAFGNNSPGKVGVWLGWEIVKSYMIEHPEVSVQELMLNKDYIGILNESNYKPN